MASVVFGTMRRAPFLLLLTAATAACAPRVSRGPVPSPAQAGTATGAGSGVLLTGPEGESPSPGAHLSGPTGDRASGRKPALATVAMVPSARMALALERLRDRNLVIPVTGVAPTRIEDSFSAPRDGERQHNALDILAPRNTPIVAADDGEILRLSSNALGGITIYAADTDREFVYYYAHLDHYHDGLFVGKAIQKGDTLGYVGTTGNAPKDVPHLHFQVMLWPADGKFWNGEPVNPFAILRGAATSGGDRLRFD